MKPLSETEILKFIAYVRNYVDKLNQPYLLANRTVLITQDILYSNASNGGELPPDIIEGPPEWTPETPIDWNSENIDEIGSIAYYRLQDFLNAFNPFPSSINSACIPMFDDPTLPAPYNVDVNFMQINGYADGFSRLGPFNRETGEIDVDTRYAQTRGLFYTALSGICQDYWIRYYIFWSEFTKVIDDLTKKFEEWKPDLDPKYFTDYDETFETTDISTVTINRPDDPGTINDPGQDEVTATKTVITYYLYHVNYPEQHRFWLTYGNTITKEIQSRIKRINEMLSDLGQFAGKIQAYKDLGLAGSKAMSMAAQFDNSKNQVGPIKDENNIPYNMIGVWDISGDYIEYFNTSICDGYRAYRESLEIELPEREPEDVPQNVIGVIQMMSMDSITKKVENFDNSPEGTRSQLSRIIALENMNFFGKAKELYDWIEELVFRKYKFL